VQLTETRTSAPYGGVTGIRTYFTPPVLKTLNSKRIIAFKTTGRCPAQCRKIYKLGRIYDALKSYWQIIKVIIV